MTYLEMLCHKNRIFFFQSNDEWKSWWCLRLLYIFTLLHTYRPNKTTATSGKHWLGFSCYSFFSYLNKSWDSTSNTVSSLSQMKPTAKVELERNQDINQHDKDTNLTFFFIYVYFKLHLKQGNSCNVRHNTSKAPSSFLRQERSVMAQANTTLKFVSSASDLPFCRSIP